MCSGIALFLLQEPLALLVRHFVSPETGNFSFERTLTADTSWQRKRFDHTQALSWQRVWKRISPQAGQTYIKFQNQANFKQAQAVSTHPNVVFVLILDGDSRSDTSKAFGQYGKSFWCLASSSNHQRYTVWQLWMIASVLWLTPPPSSWCFETER